MLEHQFDDMFRLRYTPLGWSKKYEFNESDLKCACDTIDRWIDDTAKGDCRPLFFLLFFSQKLLPRKMMLC